MVFTEEFNKITENKYDYLSPSSVELNLADARATVELIVPHDKLDNELKDGDKEAIFEAVRAIIPLAFDVSVKYKKFYVDNLSAINKTREFFHKNYPAIPSDGIDIDASVIDAIVNISIGVSKLFFSTLDTDNIVLELEKYLHTKFTNKITIALTSIEREAELQSFTERKTEEFFVRRKVKTDNHFVLAGRSIGSDPSYIADKGEVEKLGVYCGVVESFERRISKKSGNPYYVFTISDTTGQLVCKAFSKTEKSAFDQVKEGSTVIVQGKIDRDAYAGESVMLVSDLSQCVIDYASIVNEKMYNSAPIYYEYVTPKPYVQVSQSNMFKNDNSVPECLIGREFIVFDLETTGIEKESCMITEIGAVKIIDGVIKEGFSTFVNPQCHIPEVITQLTSIRDEDVKDAPTIENVFPDFYKFIEGIPLVAQNAPFDMGFIGVVAKKMNYNLSNRVYDTIELSRKVVKSPSYKLETLCKLFGVDNEHAHRAIHDAAATAEVFIEAVRLGESKNIKMI